MGLGKTIETALALRELASRGELKRALMIVPAGLVNNWAHELNEVFNLNFEVFGSEGDVTDTLYVILSGRVKVFVTDEQGKEIVLGTIPAGDYFGELVLDGTNSYRGTTYASDNTVLVLGNGHVTAPTERKTVSASTSRSLRRKLTAHPFPAVELAEERFLGHCWNPPKGTHLDAPR